MIFNKTINGTKQQIYRFLNKVEEIENLDKLYKDQYGFIKFIENNNFNNIDTILTSIEEAEGYIESLMFLIELDKKVTEQKIIFPNEIHDLDSYIILGYLDEFEILYHLDDSIGRKIKSLYKFYFRGEHIKHLKNEYDKVTRHKELLSKLEVKNEVKTTRKKI